MSTAAGSGEPATALTKRCAFGSPDFMNASFKMNSIESQREIRAVRQWHYDQYLDYAQRAGEMQKKSDSRMFQRDSRDAFERTAQAYQAKASQHLRFVRALNELFPEADRLM
jgi:hypothetical protein